MNWEIIIFMGLLKGGASRIVESESVHPLFSLLTLVCDFRRLACGTLESSRFMWYGERDVAAVYVMALPYLLQYLKDVCSLPSDPEVRACQKHVCFWSGLELLLFERTQFPHNDLYNRYSKYKLYNYLNEVLHPFYGSYYALPLENCRNIFSGTCYGDDYDTFGLIVHALSDKNFTLAHYVHRKFTIHLPENCNSHVLSMLDSNCDEDRNKMIDMYKRILRRDGFPEDGSDDVDDLGPDIGRSTTNMHETDLAKIVYERLMAREITPQKAHFFISGNDDHSFIKSNNPSVRDYVVRIIAEKPQCDAVLSDVYQYLSDDNVNTLQTYAEQANNPFTLKRLHERNQATRWLSKPLSNRPEHVCNEHLRRCGSGRYLPTGSQRRFPVSHQKIPPKIAGEIAAFIPRD